jgi:transposase InsO family protein
LSSTFIHSKIVNTVIRIITAWFRSVGFPQYVYSDSGPQFKAAKFKDYCAKHYITPLVSSACFPQSNGLAEAAVKSVKYLLLKSDNYSDFEKKLYEMQSVPSSGGTLSPAEKFFNRRFCSYMPTLDPLFDPILQVVGRKQFLVGDRVSIQNTILKHWDDKGTISKIRDSGRSYYVDRDIGQDTVFAITIFWKD